MRFRKGAHIITTFYVALVMLVASLTAGRKEAHIITIMNVVLVVISAIFITGCGPSTRTMSPVKPTSKPYTIKGIKYHPQPHFEYSEVGVASYYGVRDGFHGKKTATGETFNAHGLTAAHKTLPLPSVVRVTNLDNGRSLLLKVNDRGPFYDGRIIDVSQKAAKMLGFYSKGIAKVRVDCLVQESLALQDQPRDHIPIMIAEANIPDNTVIPDKKRQVIDIAKLPVQKMLAQATHTTSLPDAIPLPKKRPGWLAIKELLTPANKGNKFAASSYNETPTVHTAAVSAPLATWGIYIQAGTFSKYNNAQRLTHKLKPLTKGVPVRLNTVAVNKTPMFTVRLGPVESSEDAEQIIQRMAQAGHYDAKIIYE